MHLGGARQGRNPGIFPGRCRCTSREGLSKTRQQLHRRIDDRAAGDPKPQLDQLGDTPLFPFRHGLSYGSFTYTDLTVDEASVELDGTLIVSVQVANTGHREAAEVVQLYLHQRHGSASRPVRELK